ncbi:polysaccharide pyruvyl transferase family protein [Rhodococcus ruber]|uniref:polysaccharide pyruvyl transferase family protein n=1 Tax=Rhodococcus ruber TaxID=1830 RepID=UPI0009E9940F|nr:polysaccharide pyruvyl transferase family protein [Rhodococcus ruber]
MKRVLVVGASGWGNVGDDLIAVRIAEWLKPLGMKVVVAGGPIGQVPLPQGAEYVSSSGSTLSRVRLVYEIVRSRHVIIGGGGLLDDRSPTFYRPFARISRFARLIGRRYSLVSVGVGPIRNAGTAGDYQKIVDGASSVSVRDPESKNRLQSCGVRQHVDVVSDPALWATVTDNNRSSASFDLAINLRCWADSDGRRSDNFRRGTREIVDEVAEAVNTVFGPESSVVLVSMSKLEGDNDSTVLELLAEKLESKVDKVYSCQLSEVESAVQSSRHVLSMRLHLALMGVSYGKSVAGISYDAKISQQGRIWDFPVVDLDENYCSATIADALARSVNCVDREGFARSSMAPTCYLF